MNPQELRIGNLIGNRLVGPRVLEVYQIGDHIQVLHNTRPIFVHPEDLEPLPLSEHWLVGFGFQKNDIGDWEMDSQILPIGVLSSGQGFMPIIRDYYVSEVRLNFVHQLQNLYFALTGEELKIERNGKY